MSVKDINQILYEDSQVSITRQYILIKKYYFPLATSKTICFDEIQTIHLGDNQGVKHSWGTCGKYLNNWFAYDPNRSSKLKFIEFIIKKSDIKPTVTPENPDACFNILYHLFTPSDKENSNSEASQPSKKEIEKQPEQQSQPVEQSGFSELKPSNIKINTDQ